MKKIFYNVAFVLITYSVLLFSCNEEEDPDPFEATVSISASDASANEEGPDDGEFTVSLSQSNASGGALTISYTVSGSATAGADFTQLTGSVTLAEGSSSTAIPVQVIDDSEDDDDETVIVTITTSNLPDGVSAGGATSATLTITDNDDSGGQTGGGNTITVVASDAEGTEGSDDAEFSISLSSNNTLPQDIVLNYTIGGTANEGTDYATLPGKVTISMGSSAAKVTIDIIDDDEQEIDETVILTIETAPPGITIGNSSSATITIKDNGDTGSGTGTTCANDNSIDQENFACTTSAGVASSYSESISGGNRTITANGVPDHDYRIQIPQLVQDINAETRVYVVDTQPTAAASSTSLTNSGKPIWVFGIALNGVKIDPAPAEPFIFTDGSGEYVWDWVFEPTNNMEAVGLDCAIAHFQPDGQYHYHGDMAIYADQLLAGLGAGTAAPSEAVQIGWAADGYPILYKYGPNANGVFEKLSSSYQLKEGERPGDGDSEPCGEYNGKYTNDYTYVADAGDLDECNGIAQTITLGGETFDYFYVITEEFPVISRCIKGTPSNDFRLGPG
ncbi:MAG: YHYH protein [Cyclobacteriaceae bacterium]|nr:YHYH protein [Cyclobacteriaceae bacterium HetDA_MAG_MS6]